MTSFSLRIPEKRTVYHALYEYHYEFYMCYAIGTFGSKVGCSVGTEIRCLSTALVVISDELVSDREETQRFGFESRRADGRWRARCEGAAYCD